MVPSWGDQNLPQLLMEQFDTLPIQSRHIEYIQLLMERFDTLPIQCRHIELMHEGVWLEKIFFDKVTARRM